MGSVNHDNHQGKLIRARRKELKISMRAMAQMIGVTRQSIQDFEKGKRNVPSKRINQFAEILKIKPHDLMFAAFKRPLVTTRLGLPTPTKWYRQTDPEWGAYVWDVRISLKLTREDFASRIGVRAETVKGWELGQFSPYKAQMEKIRHRIQTLVDR
jgi:transcriptional regulator with XRE-family HTH domain